MNRPILIIIFTVLCHLLTFSQATSLTIDCQNPGWLSSKINFSDQLTVKNLTVTGYLNKTDYAFISELIQRRNLSGHIDLSETYFVGSSSNNDNKLTFNLRNLSSGSNTSIEFISLPISLTFIDDSFFTLMELDSLEIGGPGLASINKTLLPENLAYLMIREGVNKVNIEGYFENYKWNVYGNHELNHPKLGTIILPKSAVIFPRGSFSGLNSLKNFTFPSWAEDLGDGSFANTPIIKDTSLSLTKCSTLNFAAFWGAMPKEIFFSNKLTSLYDNCYYDNNSGSSWSDSNTGYTNAISKSNPITLYLFSPSLVPLNTQNSRGAEGYTIYVRENLVNEYANNTTWSKATIIANPSIDSISFNVQTIMYVGDTYSLEATIEPDNSKDKIEYSSDDLNVSFISNNTIRCNSPGNVTLKALAVFNEKEAWADSYIYEHTTGIILDTQEMVVKPDSIFQIKGQTLPLETSDNRIIWKSSNEGIATVNQQGFVHALKSGECVITARTLDKGYEATCKVIVHQPVTGVMLNYNTVELHKIGETVQLVATVLPEDASNKEVRWMSSNQSVCMVANGTVDAVGYGTSVIIATTVDGSHMATCTVNVVEGADMPGDVNHDGEVNIADINAIIDIILGGDADDKTRERADVNGDGEVNIADINAVIDIILN